MKLVTFRSEAGAPELGAVVVGGRIAPLSRAAPRLAVDMIDLITRWPQVAPEARRLAAEATDLLDLDAVTLLAPIPRPGKIMAIGLNYADHIAESGMATPEYQTWFAKAATSAYGPFAPVEVPKASSLVDYEAELVAVVGARGRHFSRDAAPGAVFGFCVGNDVSVNPTCQYPGSSLSIRPISSASSTMCRSCG